jgi:hypothetical protein
LEAVLARGMMEECDVASVAAELMIGSWFGSRHDGGARGHVHHTSRVATSLYWLLISSYCDVISGDRVHGYTLRLLADFLPTASHHPPTQMLLLGDGRDANSFTNHDPCRTPTQALLDCGSVSRQRQRPITNRQWRHSEPNLCDPQR